MGLLAAFLIKMHYLCSKSFTSKNIFTMRRFQTFLFFLCLAVTNCVWAGPITESQAKAVAENFLASHGALTARLITAHKAPRMGAAPTSSQAAYYVFNGDRSNSGFIIVAGDDRAPAVLGYSDRGTFDANAVPLAMQEWLDAYADQIEELDKGAQAAPQLQARPAIRPLVPAVWSQNNPFNILFPFLPNGKHAYVGCVATAFAQVMYYWQWPARPTRSISAYTSTYVISSTDTLKINMPELPVIDFDWSAMQDTYLTTDTTSQAAIAASRLSLYCAQAVEMTFKPNASGATTSSVPLRATTYFDYDASAHMEGRESYTTQGWADLLYAELAAGRPVIYSGSKKNSGHAFICDGYDGNGMFHINWGWNGQSNGYFLLNVLNPDLQGTGSASGTYGYIYSQGAVVGFQPNQGGQHIFEVTAENVLLNSYEGTRSSSSDSFKAYVSGEFHNYTSDTLDLRFGWGLFQGSEMIEKLYSAYNHTLRPGYLHRHTNRELLFGAGLTSGTYRIMPMCTEYSNPDGWRPCAGAENNYIEVTIDGNNCYFEGHGTAATTNYTVNDITYTGFMHPTRPVDINVNMTNNGQSDNVLLYMFANGTFIGTGYVGLVPGETGDIPFRFVPDAAGTYTLTFSFNDDGSNPIATRTITINAMPAANLSGSLQVLNATDYVINDNKFSVVLTVTNNGSTAYNEDISIKMYKHIYGNMGTTVQAINKPLSLAAGATTTIQFDLDNVINGWEYFVNLYYYSSGSQVNLTSSYYHTIVFPEEPQVLIGDVNGDNEVTIKDVTTLIDYLLGSNTSINADGADVNRDGDITIKDVTQLIDMLLNNQ